MKVIYQPKGRAFEYGELALNIYLNCPHNCVYCSNPLTLHKNREEFHKFENCKPRENIVELVKKDLSEIQGQGKHIFLSFIGDPFPMGIDHEPTRQIIKAIHDSGNFAQILTKGELTQEDFDCLTEDDIYGCTISCGDELAKKIEPNAERPTIRLLQLHDVKFGIGCKTFVSCEPVFETEIIYSLIRGAGLFIDEYKIGKLNYAKSDIDWKAFGIESEKLCKLHNRKYYIKESLRAEMNK